MHRRDVVTFAVAALLCSVLVISTPGLARADDTVGLDVSSSSVFTVDPTASVARAAVDLSLANTTVDQEVGSSVRRQYFTGYTFPVPAGSTAHRAMTEDGRAVPVAARAIPDNDNFLLLTLTFPDPLFSAERTVVDVTYDIIGRPPRSTDPSRVNPAYVAFTAYGIGDPGQASIEVTVPSTFEIDTFGDDDIVSVSVEDGSTRYSVASIPDPGSFALFVSARNDDALRSTEHGTDDGAAFVVRSWPDDPVWQQFVVDQIDQGIPLLAQLIERPWPIERPVEIRQAVTPYLYGYAGWFSAANAELEVGEDLDADTVLHELSHAWFNSTWFAERWASEGLAQVYTDSTVALLGGSPTGPAEPAADDPASIALVDWGAPLLEQGADATEAYGYETSHWIMQRIVEEVGFAALADVMQAIIDGALPYTGDDTTPSTAGLAAGPADWQRLLDLLEEVGGSETAATLIGRYVARPSESAEFTERGVARDAYRRLTTTGDTWAPPLVARRAMAEWEFEVASDAISDAGTVLERRDRLETLSGPLELELTDDLEIEYEAATSLEQITDTLDRRIAAAERLTQSVTAVASDPGLIERLGLVGADPGAFLEQARRALAAGDTVAATAAAERALSIVDDAQNAGYRRAAIALGIALVLAVAIALISFRLRRRSANRAMDQAADT